MHTSPIELMTTLGHQYRSLRSNHQQEGPNGTTRRKLADQMETVAGRFERLVQHWVHDQPVREAWLDFMYRGATPPDKPQLAAPPLFRGSNQTGALVEIYETRGGGHDVLLDGTHAAHYETPWQSQPDRFAPVVIGEWICAESFAAPAPARRALGVFVSHPGAEPPWTWASALFEDGLIDVNFGLLPRGARATSIAVERISTERTNFCVLLVNAGRSRVFTLATDDFDEISTFEPLVEVADTTNAIARASDAERFTDTRPGLRREGPHGPRHAVSDRRENHRKQSQRQYIEQVVDAAAAVWSQFEACRIVVVAGPQMLTLLRPALARRIHDRNRFVVHEYTCDLSWQEAAAVHDRLASAGFLPARGRKPPLRPMRTPNPWQSGG